MIAEAASAIATLAAAVRCPRCAGIGVVTQQRETCPVCLGLGRVPRALDIAITKERFQQNKRKLDLGEIQQAKQDAIKRLQGSGLDLDELSEKYPELMACLYSTESTV